MVQIHRILVPLDGSASSEASLPWAAMLARQSGAQLQLLRAAWPENAPGGELGVAESRSLHEAEAYLDRVAGELAAQACMVESLILLEEPACAIRHAAAETAADLLIMAAHGSSGSGERPHGSVAHEALCWTPIPLLLVQDGSGGSTPPLPPGGVLLTLSGWPAAEAALPWAETLAHLWHARLALLRVVEGSGAEQLTGRQSCSSGEAEAALEDARSYLRSVRERLGRNGLEVWTEVRTGPVAETIAAYAREVAAGLIVLPSPARRGVSRLLHHGHTSAVLREATPALLLVPASER